MRLIASTNRDLARELKSGNFREDLYYRLNVVQIKLPPLRERMSDITLLVTHFIDKFAHREKKRVTSVSPEVMEVFLNYNWPGNLRQLEHVMERAVVLSRGEIIGLKDIQQDIKRESQNLSQRKNVKPLRQQEMETIIQTLDLFRGNKSKAAKALGITRKSLYNRLKHIDPIAFSRKIPGN